MINRKIGLEKTVYLTDNPLVQGAGIAIVILSGCLILKNREILSGLSKHSISILIIVHVVIALFLLLAVIGCRYHPISDQGTCLEVANSLIHGNYSSWQKGYYVYVYPFQTSLILFFVPAVAAFGIENGALVIQILNILMLLLGSFALYMFCREIKTNAFITSVLYITYLPFGLYVFFVYGNVSALALSMVSLWMAVRYLATERIRYIVISAFAAGMACLFKFSSYSIVASVIVVFLVIGVARKRFRILSGLVLYIVICLGCTKAPGLIIERITHEELTSGLSRYGHFYMGISEGDRASGWWNDYPNQTIMDLDFDLEAYEILSKRLFFKRAYELLNNQEELVAFLARKTASQWNNPTFQSVWIQQQMLYEAEKPMNLFCCDGSFWNMVYYYVYNLLLSILYFGLMYFFLFKSDEYSFVAYIPALNFLAGFVYLLLMEAKAQYTILLLMPMLPYAVSGMCAVIKDILSLGRTEKWYRSRCVCFLGILVFVVLILSFVDADIINHTIKLGDEEADLAYELYLQMGNGGQF